MSTDKPSLDASSPPTRQIKSSSGFLSLKSGTYEPSRKKVPVILSRTSPENELSHVVPPKPQHRYGNANRKIRPLISSAFVPQSPARDTKKRISANESPDTRSKSPRSDICVAVKRLTNVSKSLDLDECRLIIPGTNVLRQNWIVKGSDGAVEFDVEGSHFKKGIFCKQKKALILEIRIQADTSLIYIQLADNTSAHDLDAIYERLQALDNKSETFGVIELPAADFALFLHNYRGLSQHTPSKIHLVDSSLEDSHTPNSLSNTPTKSSGQNIIKKSPFFEKGASTTSRDEVSVFNTGRELNGSTPAKDNSTESNDDIAINETSVSSSSRKNKPVLRLRKSVDKKAPSTFESDSKEFGNSDFRYTFADGKDVTIGPADFKRLDNEEYLNDTLIDFFLRLILEKWAPGPVAERTYIFNTFFYEKISQKEEKAKKYEKVMKWTSKVNIFDMKNVIIPVFSNMHWYMAVLYNLPLLLTNSGDDEAKITGINEKHLRSRGPVDLQNEPLIMIFDSLRHINYNSVYRTLRDYVAAEASDKLGLTVNTDLLRAKIIATPQQTNYCDCGVYLIHYVERYLGDPDEFVRTVLAVGTEKNQQLVSQLWHVESLSHKREHLRKSLLLVKKKADRDSQGQSIPIAHEESEDDEIVFVNETKHA